jgi:hypothetical protein
LQREHERLRKEEEAERLAEERAKQEYLHKNKEYFELNKAYREYVPKGYPVFYGDNIDTHGAWVAHGHGTMTVRGIVQYEGNYKMGKRDGLGVAIFDDGSKWDGQFRDGFAHGSGQFTPARTHVQQTIAKSRKNNTLAIQAAKAVTPSEPSNQSPLLLLQYMQDEDMSPRFGRQQPVQQAVQVQPPRKSNFQSEDDHYVPPQPMEALMNQNTIICFKAGMHMPANVIQLGR